MKDKLLLKWVTFNKYKKREADYDTSQIPACDET